MTAAELIAELQKLGPDDLVIVVDPITGTRPFRHIERAVVGGTARKGAVLELKPLPDDANTVEVYQKALQAAKKNKAVAEMTRNLMDRDR